jgi:protein TonB
VKRPLIIFYALALAFHAVVLFCLKPPAPKPPKILNETYVDVTLTTKPQPESPKPIVVPPPPQPKIETSPPKTEEKPQPSPPPKPEITIPEPKPEPPPPAPKPVVVPPLQPNREVSVTQRALTMQVSHDYPSEAARRHQQGTVELMVFISEQGVADKVEILKSSGYPDLDSDAIRKVKRKNWGVIFQDGIPVRSSGTVTVPYILR